jgi:PAS domain S-box-containing protein
MAEPTSAHIPDRSSTAVPDAELEALIEARHDARRLIRELYHAEVDAAYDEMDRLDALIAKTPACTLATIRQKAAICRDIACSDTDLAWPMLVSLMADLQRVSLDDQATLRSVFSEVAVPLPPSPATGEDRHDKIFEVEKNRNIKARKRAEDALRDREERLRAIYDGTYQYIGLLSPDGTLLDANRASLEFAGDAFGSKHEHVVGRPFWETVWFVHTPGAPEKLREAIARAAAGEFIRYEAPLLRPSGEKVIFDFSLHPVRDKQGDVFLIVPEGRIITDRKRAEEELAESEKRFRTSILHSPVPTVLYDDHQQILAVSQSWLEAAGGVSANDFPRIEDWTIYFFGERSSEMLELQREIIATEPVARTDELLLTLGGEKRIWNFFTSSLGLQSDGRRLFVVMAQDVTDRRAYEERIDLLMRESHHRIKNILSLVQAIARQTTADDTQDFIDRFSERIRALAANQDLLVRHEWRRIELKDLVQSQLRPFADLIGTRINFDGPKLLLNAAAAQAIGLALHELATNAGKYGALSMDAGRVDVRWQLEDDTFILGWTERGGPPARPPERRGFGSTVVESMVKYTLRGKVRLDYAPSGLEWHLICRAADALEGEADSHKLPHREFLPQIPGGNRLTWSADELRSRDLSQAKAATLVDMARDFKTMRGAIGAELVKLLSEVLDRPLPADIADLLKQLDQPTEHSFDAGTKQGPT